MLTPERARSLWEAGINQFNISLDYLDERHDEARGIPGLTAKIFDVVPRMRALGIDGIRFNTVIKRLQPRPAAADRAMRRGAGRRRELQLYTDAKNGNRGASRCARGAARSSRTVMRRAARVQAQKRGVITNSDYYLEQIPRYVRGEMHEPCRRACARSTSIPRGT